jgi:hypothetical protein
MKFLKNGVLSNFSPLEAQSEITEKLTLQGREVIGEGTTLPVQPTSNLQVNWQT